MDSVVKTCIGCMIFVAAISFEMGLLIGLTEGIAGQVKMLAGCVKW